MLAMREPGNTNDILLLSTGTSSLGRASSFLLGGNWAGMAAPGGDVEIKTRGQYVHSNLSDVVWTSGAGNRGPGDGSTFWALQINDLGGTAPRKGAFLIQQTSAGGNSASFYTTQTETILSLSSHFNFDHGGFGLGGWIAGSTVAAYLATGSTGLTIATNGSLTAGNTFTPTVRLTLSPVGALRLHAYGAGFLQTDASGNVTAGAITGGSIVLAGDVTGNYNANTAVGLTGTAGVVAMHGTTIRSDAGVALEIASGTGSPPAAFSLRRGTTSPFLIADGSGGSGSVYLGGYPILNLDGDDMNLRSAAGALKATWTMTGIAFGTNMGAPTIQQTEGAGLGGAFKIRARNSTDNVGADLDLHSGTGTITGEMTMRRGNASPFLTAAGSGGSANVVIGGYPSLVLDSDTLTVREANGTQRAVWTAAALNFDAAVSFGAPNFIFDIPSGNLEVVIAAANRFVVTSTRLEVGVPSLRWEDIGVGFKIEQIASATDGSVCRIIAQEGSGGDGGNLELIGGITNGATRGGVALVVGGDVSDPGGVFMVEVRNISAQFVTAIGATAGISGSDFPADVADPAVYVGNASPSTIGAGYPVNGFVMFSDDGRPGFKTAVGAGAVGQRLFTIDGEMTVSAGALDRYMVWVIDGVRYKMPVHLDA